MIKGILAGIVAALILQFLSASLAEYVAGCCLGPQAAAPIWFAVASAPLGAVVTLVPGFITGWLSPSRGILAGFIAGLLGNAIYAATFHTMWSSVGDDGASAIGGMIIRLFVLASSWALFSAAAAGTAQFLRRDDVRQRDPDGSERHRNE